MTDTYQEAEHRYPDPTGGSFRALRSELNAERRTAFVAGAEWQTKQSVESPDDEEKIAGLLANQLAEDGNRFDDRPGSFALEDSLEERIETIIDNVYADCDDEESAVLATNISTDLSLVLPKAVLSIVRGVS